MIPELPSFDELDPLAPHLDELEDPDSNLLEDFFARQQETDPDVGLEELDGTPLSVGGYTSEESEYSISAPLDEQIAYETGSFLPKSSLTNSSSFADECMTSTTRFVSSSARTSLGEYGTASNGVGGGGIPITKPRKTSKYRGVTQTSKSSWGAKYSAKRITNTCKTPEEAARAYDAYLKIHYPQKYERFANFCAKCGQFVNPLGLENSKNECECVDGIHESVPPAMAAGESPRATRGGPVATFGECDHVAINDPANEMREGSNFSIGSICLSFPDEKLLEGDFTYPVDLMNVDQNTPPNMNNGTIQATPTGTGTGTGTVKSPLVIKEEPMQLEPQQPTNAQSTTNKPPCTRNDSLPLNIISDAFDSFETNGHLEKLIREMNEDGELQLELRTSESGEMMVVNRKSDHLLVLTSDDINELKQCLGTHEESVMETSQVSNASSSVPMLQPQHSLDFNLEPLHTSAPTPTTPHQLQQILETPPDHHHHHQHYPVAVPETAPLPAPLSACFQTHIDFQTPFLEKYWRNDRKNIQCFPFCPEHGDYYRVRIEDLQHHCKGVCRAAVKARVTIELSSPLDPVGLIVLARCNSDFSKNAAMTSLPLLNATQMKTVRMLSAHGAIEELTILNNGLFIEFLVTFYPDVWKFEFDLPKKRRHNQGRDGLSEYPGAEFLYFFEMDVFHTSDHMNFLRLGYEKSMDFQIGNTRTLLRQRNKMKSPVQSAMATPDAEMEYGNSNSSYDLNQHHVNVNGAINVQYHKMNDDFQLDASALPEKKKIRVQLGQRAESSMSFRGDSMLEDEKVMEEFDGGKESLKGLSSDIKPAPAPLMTEDVVDVVAEEPYEPHTTPRVIETKAEAQVAGVAAAAVVAAPMVADAAYNIADESLVGLMVYDLASGLLGMCFVPLGLVLLVVFLVLFPLAPNVVRLMDTIADFDLSLANRYSTPSKEHYGLSRLEKDGQGMFRYHGQGQVWSRFVYLLGIKLVVSAIALVIAVPVAVITLLVVPCGSASGIRVAGINCAKIARDYTRSTVGIKLTDSTRPNDGDVV